MHAARYVTSSLLVALLCAVSLRGEDSPEALEYFEREVRPILVDTCQKCHGEKKQEAELRLDSREALIKGGYSGAAVEPGHPEKSLLIAAVRHEGDTQMPPKQKLPEAQITALVHWVKIGAPWPKEATVSKNTDAARTHWAFQPVVDPPVPMVAGNASSNPIDAFVYERLAKAGLAVSPPADRRALIRRATFSVTGLPPTAEEVEAFERDTDPRAYENLVERLLASPHYGEQWGRHWLDVARYSDTKGYVYAREQRVWLHAWVYRDWIVKALNDDLPYNQFLLLQIAADQAAPDDKAAHAAMGFLTLGRRFLGVQRDIIDDRIDVVTRGTMGLTVGCARCHDHKYDPIPTKDYYSLYGIFQSSSERIEQITEPAAKDEAYQKYEAELNVRRKNLADAMAAKREETSARNRSRAGDYLAAQLELHKYPQEGFDQILYKTDLLPTFVHIWQAYLAQAEKQADPVFAAWHAYAEIPAKEFAAKAGEVTRQLAARPAGEVHPLVLKKFKTPPGSMSEVAARYGELFTAALPEGGDAALREVLFAANGPCTVPDEPLVNIEYYFDSDTNNELWKVENELQNWILQAPPELKHAAILVDRSVPSTPRVFKRGNPANKGDEIPRQFVSVVAGPDREPFAHGSGRLELAQAIIDPKNPLTARVIVNRVWTHHFGAGLVLTPSDFGTRAPPPSHPELLDWLTSRFIEDGWSLKKLHRRLLLSDAYARSSAGPADAAQVAKANQLDPENRLLWRANQQRLTFEQMRDALLASTGRLDRTVGGRAGDLFSPQFNRRTLYGSIDRQFLPSTLRVFDFANPDLHIPLRTDTTVPQQALFFMNHPLMIGHAQALAAKSDAAANPEQRVQQMYRAAYQRAATPEQVAVALELIALSQEDKASIIPPTVADWQYGYGGLDEKAGQVTGFTKLPHFTGSAWQGGAAFPDPALGWVQLTAAGGHPGNDLAHAVVRRWTAPRDMTISVRSTLVHEPTEGEGVRGFIVASRGGLLAQATVHNKQAELNLDALEVKAGDTLDFVTDIGNKLSYNQFLWKATIAPADGSTAWDSQRDFENQGTKRLDAWEQLAQVLLSANEFVFVD